MSKTIDKIVFSGIIFVLIFTQLAFGGVHVWAYSVFEISNFSISSGNFLKIFIVILVKAGIQCFFRFSGFPFSRE